MVVLWTDALIYLLLLSLLGLGFYLRGKAHIKRPLQSISNSKVGMVSLVVLPLLFMGSYTIDAINSQNFAIVRAMVFLGLLLYVIALGSPHFL